MTIKVGDKVRVNADGNPLNGLIGYVQRLGTDQWDPLPVAYICNNLSFYLTELELQPEPKRYAIALQPTSMFTGYPVVAIVTSDTKPLICTTYVAIELKGYYTCTVGEKFGPECVQTYKHNDGTYSYYECMVDTSGT